MTELTYLMEKLDKLIFVNRLIIAAGQESTEALYTLEDEIKQLENLYLSMKNKMERLV